MDFIKNHKKQITTIAGLLIFILALFVTVFFIFKRLRSEYNADYTDTLLWANAAVTSGRFIDPDYWYAYFLPFSGIPLMIPIVATFGLTYFSHQLGMAAFTVILAAALYGFMRAMNCERGEAFALSGITMILMCASNITRMIFYGHIIHYSLCIVFMCVAFTLLKRSTVFSSDGAHSWFFTFAIPVWCMLCTTNGMATVILFFIPFVGCLVLERYLDKKPFSYKDDKPILSAVILFCIGGLLGFAIKMIFFGSLEYEDSITSLLPFDGWMWQQTPFINEWVTVLTGKSSVDVKMASFDGIRILSMYYFAILLLIVPLIALISYRKIKERMLRLLILYYHISFALMILTYSVSYAITFNWRMSGIVCLAIMTTMLFTLYAIKNRFYTRFFVLLIPVIAVLSIITMFTVKRIPSALDANQNDQIIGILKDHGLTRGYSFFWNGANAVTVLSDNEIVISPIETFPDGHYEVRKYQSEPANYEDVPGLDRYFVIVDGQDIGHVGDTLGTHKIEEIKYQDDMYIWVFDRNIFRDLEPVFNDKK